MEKCICTKEKEINALKDKIHQIEIKDMAKEKDMEKFQESLDRLNDTLDDLKEIIEKINSKPLQRYEKVAWVAVSAVIAYFMGKILA